MFQLFPAEKKIEKNFLLTTKSNSLPFWLFAFLKLKLGSRPSSRTFWLIFTCWATMSEVEETLKRIQAHKGVVGVIVVNSEGDDG